MNLTKGLIFFVVLLASGGGAGYYYWTSTPEYSLLQIRAAVETHNIELFNKHVDVESVISRGVDVVMEDSISEATTSEASGMEAFGKSMAAGMIAMMKPKIVEYATNKIEMAIEGRPVVADKSATGEVNPFENVETFFSASNDLKQAYLKKDEHIAYLGLERFDKKLNDTLTLEFKLRKFSGYWQVVEVSNLKAMFERTETLKTKRLTEINLPIQERIDALVNVIHAGKENLEINRWSKKVKIDITVINNSGEMLSGFQFVCELLDEQFNVIRSLNLNINEVSSEKEETYVWELDTNRFKSEDKVLLDMPDGPIVHVVKVNSLTLANGETLAIKTAL